MDKYKVIYYTTLNVLILQQYQRQLQLSFGCEYGCREVVVSWSAFAQMAVEWSYTNGCRMAVNLPVVGSAVILFHGSTVVRVSADAIVQNGCTCGHTFPAKNYSQFEAVS